MHIEFAQPQWLWIAVAVSAVLAGLAVRAQKKRRKAVARLAGLSPDSTLAPRWRGLRQALAITGAGLVCVALARPYAGSHWEQTPRAGIDLMFAVDTSKSMHAADLKPDRLTRAKLAVADLVRKFDTDRVGLIAFAGDAFVQAPMTVDRGAFLEALDALDTDVIPRGGTDLASAIRAGVQAMGSEPTHQKVMVLLSDGEDLAGSALDAAREAAKSGLTLYTVGVGTAQGELVAAGSGEVIRSRLDEPMMRSIAEATGGAYQPLGSDGRGLDALYASARAKSQSSLGAPERHRVLEERFQYPLALALMFLALDLLLSERRRRRHAFEPSVALGVAMLALPMSAGAAGVEDYNSGTATYRKGDFATAQKHFETALKTPDVPLQVNTYYDLGNARYRSGEAAQAKDKDATIAAWKQALAAYDGALALAPKDGDAKFNRDLVAKKLAALEEQKKKKEEQQQKQSAQNQPQPDRNDKKDKSGQGQQPKDPPGQAKNDQKDQNGQQPKDKDQQGQANNDSQVQPQGDKRDAPDAAAHADSSHPKGEVATAAQQQAQEQAAQQAADAAHRAAGELTRNEALQLLDSVQRELKPLPIRSNPKGQPDRTAMRDW